MKTTQYFIYLLSCHLNEEKPKGEKRIDWQKLYDISEKQGVTSVIAYEIKQLSEDYRPNGTIASWFNEKLEASIHEYRASAKSLGAITEALSDCRIPHMLIKGIILRNYYPVPEFRVGRDADILVKQADYLKAIDTISKMGFDTNYIKSNIAELQLEKSIYKIHTELENINIQSKIYFATPFDDISTCDYYTYKLKPVYHLLYLVSHIVHHLKTGGSGIRMIMDIDSVIRKYPEININEFLLLSDHLNIGKTAEALLAFSKKIFNTPIVLNFTFEDYDTKPLFNDFIYAFMYGNVFGTKRAENDFDDSNIFKSLINKLSGKNENKSELSRYQLELLDEMEIKK